MAWIALACGKRYMAERPRVSTTASVCYNPNRFGHVIRLFVCIINILAYNVV